MDEVKYEGNKFVYHAKGFGKGTADMNDDGMDDGYEARWKKHI